MKVIDNHTSSSVKARYGNKVFNGELIIITSSVPLWKWYRHLQYTGAESLKQLYRRITVYVEITKDDISVYNELDDKGRPKGFPAYFKNELSASAKPINKKKTDFVEAFASICEGIPLEEYLESKGVLR